jgi:Trypsin-co-occurring domain 1
MATVVPVTLSTGSKALVEVTPTDTEVEVADRLYAMKDFTSAIGDLADDLIAPLARLKTDSLELSFGLALSIETGKLTALLVGGGANASVTVTARWEGRRTAQDSSEGDDADR